MSDPMPLPGATTSGPDRHRRRARLDPRALLRGRRPRPAEAGQARWSSAETDQPRWSSTDAGQPRWSSTEAGQPRWSSTEADDDRGAPARTRPAPAAAPLRPAWDGPLPAWAGPGDGLRPADHAPWALAMPPAGVVPGPQAAAPAPAPAPRPGEPGPGTAVPSQRPAGSSVPAHAGDPAAAAVPVDVVVPPAARAGVPADVVPPRGPWAHLTFADGRTLVLTGTALVGRDPAPRVGESPGMLVAVPDPGRSVSKTHLGVGVDAAGAWVVDRQSTNGTVVMLPDGQQILCVPERRVRLTPGSSVSFGDHGFVLAAP